MPGTTKPPVWYWVVGGLALIWNLLGVKAYLARVMMTEEAIAALPEAERALYTDAPTWAVGAFAIAVWAGALGCVVLLLRKSVALPVLIVSLVAIVVQDIHSFFIADSMVVYGPTVMIMPMMVLVIAVALVWHARSSIAKGWLA
jgi:hypothetical protein